MATHRNYQCTHCDYEVTMSGRPDCLMSGYTIPVVCDSCHSIYDLPDMMEVWEDGSGECPECDHHTFSRWDYKKKSCPKCSKGRMRIDPDGYILMAD